MVRVYSINIDEHIKKYIQSEVDEFSHYIASSVIRKSISEFYGMIRGFSIDNVINTSEINCILQWKQDHQQYEKHKEFAFIIEAIDRILEDGIITADEIMRLQGIVKSYLDIISTAPVTLAIQILEGIMKGITVDGNVSEGECKSLRQWLYDNIYLMGHYPFDKVMNILDDVLSDEIITKDESAYITCAINGILNPIAALKSQVNSVDGKHVCLSGTFAYGEKSDVGDYIVEHGGIVDASVKKSTDVLMIGDYECQAYSNGTYGTKVKRAIEYNEKGCTIQIVKESDFFREARR